jgi:hypothetical protein
MKKFNFLFALTCQLIIISSAVLGQVSNYTFTTVSGAYNSVSPGTQLIGPNDEGSSSALTPIGFTFKYDGINYTNYSINSCGYFKFGSITSIEFNNNLKSEQTDPLLLLFGMT